VDYVNGGKMTEHYVPAHAWRGTIHPGYKRQNRPKSKVRIIARKKVNYGYRRPIRDKNGRIMGYK
jgi:hypothetical protein